MSVRWNATSHSSNGVLWNVPGGGPPALITSTSSPDSRVIAALTSASGSPGRETSEASQPAALICAAVLSIETGSRDEMKTSAPSPISASAQARPNPLLAAVTRALRPFNPRSIGLSLLKRCVGGRRSPMHRPRRPGAFGADACVASCARTVTYLRDALPHVLVVSLAPAAEAAPCRAHSQTHH